MSNIYLSANADSIGEQIGQHISADNHEELQRVSGAIKSAQEMLNRWAESKGGQVIVSSGDESILSIPKQALAELKTIQNKYNQLAGATLTVGVGATMSESSKALIFGKISGDKGSVVHYDPSIDSQISGEDDDLAEDSQDGLPSPDGIEQDGMDQEMEESGLADDPEAAGIDDGNGDEDNNEDEFADEAQVGEEQLEQESQEGEASFDDNDENDGAQGEFGDEGVADEDGFSDPNNGDEDNNETEFEDEEQVGADQSQLEGDEEQLGEDEAAFGEDEQEFDPSQPAHEQGMSEEEGFAHDAEENEDDEQDADNIEADEEENVFGGNTEPEDGDFAEDAAEDAAAQDLDAEGQALDPDMQEEGMEGEEGLPDESQSLPDDPEALAVDMDNDGDVDAQDVATEEEGLQELGEDDIAPQGEEDQDGSAMTDMLHANIGDEESEDSDDEIKQDVIESLMSFKQNKQHLEELKNTNPEMYEANILMLRAMIQMAKKLKMNPDAGMEDADNVQAANEQFPDADPNAEVEEDDSQEALPNPEEISKKPFGKSEIMKASKIDSVSSASQRHNRRAQIPEGGKPKQKGVHNEHSPKMHEKQAPRGQSDAGVAARASVKSNRPVDKEVGNKPARQAHLKVITEQKQMKRPNLAESEKNSVKGVHKPYMSQGQSMAGELAREGQKQSKSPMGQANVDVSRKLHQQKLGELKGIKPNLPKSEHDSVSSFKQGSRVVHNVHGAGTVAGSHGQGIHSVNFDSVADRNVKPTKVHEKNFKQPMQKPVNKQAQPVGNRPQQPTDKYAQSSQKPAQSSQKPAQSSQKPMAKPAQKPFGKSEKQTVEQMNLDLKKKKAKTGKK